MNGSDPGVNEPTGSVTLPVRRVPLLARVSCAIAAATIIGLALAVWHFSASGASGMSMSGKSMSGMSMHQMSSAGTPSDAMSVSGATHALTRGGSAGPLAPLSGSALFTAWQLDAVAVALLVLVLAAYLTGVALVPARSPGIRWPLRRTASFVAGLAVCGFATNGSIAVYDQVLFTAHMIGHLALVMVAPALLMWGRPITLALAASSPKRRRRLERTLRGRVLSVVTAPPVALAVYAVVIVGSHLTGLMDTIMRNDWAGQVEHLVYVLAGCLFFSLVVGDEPLRWRLASPARWLLLAIAMAVDTFVGIILMQGTQAVTLLPSTLHVDALSDTRTGGAIMWFGGDAIMAAIMIGLVVGWLRRVDDAPVEQGWLEQARHATFDLHTGRARAAEPGTHAGAGAGCADPDESIDEDDTAREAYNDWLQKLSRQR